MDAQFRSLTTLDSVTDAAVPLLHDLGIDTLGDLLAFEPIRQACFVRAARDRELRLRDVHPYVDAEARRLSAQQLLDAPTVVLRSVTPAPAAALERLGVRTVGDLAAFAPFREAEGVILAAVAADTDPDAPSCVLPACRKFTRNTKSYVSFFRQEEIRTLSVLSGRILAVGLQRLFHFPAQPPLIHLGFSVSYRQDWIYTGIHLGEPQGSVSLFMGQDTQVSVLDWRRATSAARRENTFAAERLSSTLFHQRAVDEVARATAEEHQFGGTTAFGANAATAGSFVAAGALVGGIGGGISGAVTGLVVGNVANAAGGLPTLAGAAVGTAVGSIAGAAAASLIVSGATTLGFVETDAEGDREVFARSAQNIQQRTIQNSSSIRSFWSDVISQSVEEEQQRIRTDRVTNHNRIHALNALYFEVLNAYRVDIAAEDFAAILFLPFQPITFDEKVLATYWWIIRTLLADTVLVLGLDERFLALNVEESPAEAIAELPKIEDVEATVTVRVDLDGSRMEDIISALVGGAVSPAMAVFRLLWEGEKRDNITVTVVTSTGRTVLDRGPRSVNDDPNFVGTFTSATRIPVHTIEAIEIGNTNDQFSLDVPGLGSFDLNKIAFEGLTAQLDLVDADELAESLPRVGDLESRQTVAEAVEVGASSSSVVPWDIAAQLAAQFEGIDELRAQLDTELAEQELLEAKLANLIAFLNANKFGFTRLILQSVEREQVVRVLEEVEIGGRKLSAIADTTPLGFSGNFVVLRLRSRDGDASDVGPISVDTTKLELRLQQFATIPLTDADAVADYCDALASMVRETLELVPADGTARDRELHDLLNELATLLESFDSARAGGTEFTPAQVVARLVGPIRSTVNKVLGAIARPTTATGAGLGRLLGFARDVAADLRGRLGEVIASSEVSLPSPAVFMEPVLSQAKGAELYDMRRNSHYEVAPAPGIGNADPNVLRARDLSLTPTLPPATLAIQNPPDLALPTGLGAALAEAGRLNLDTLVTSNAGSLNATLGRLADLASELAKSSAQLTGDAQAKALGAASDVAKQVGEILGQSLEGSGQAPPPPKPTSPQGQQEKAEAAREARRADDEGGSQRRKREQKETVGVPVQPDDTRDYQIAMTFLDADGGPYPVGEFTVTLTFFELGVPVALNGGAPLPILDGQFIVPETITLTKGRKATAFISGTFGGVTVSGLADFVLPDRQDILLQATMKSDKQQVTESSVKTAVDQTVRNSSFGVTLNPVLDLFLNGGIKFPFQIFEVSADGGQKTKLDFKFEYEKGETSTTGGTSTDTVTRTFEVVIPKNGWSIDVR
jgi:hypothetical protein